MTLISQPLPDASRDQLSIYVSEALRHGATEAEIQGLVNQASIFLGVPKAVTAQKWITETLKMLRKFPIPRTYVEKEVWVGDHSTMVRDSNPQSKAVPVVLIHALGLDRRMWDVVFAQLATTEIDSRIISYDLRGHGHAAPAQQVRDLNHLADDLHNLLETLNITKADIYGQSYGGAVAQYFALEYPSATRSLGLVTTAGEGQPAWVARATRAEEANSTDSLMAETLIRWFTPEAIARNEWGVRYARSCVERITVANWAAAWRAMSGLDTLNRLKEIKCPVHVVCGVQDASTGPKFMKRVVEACDKGSARVEYSELDPGVHMMALEQGEALTAEILWFRGSLGEKGV